MANQDTRHVKVKVTDDGTMKQTGKKADNLNQSVNRLEKGGNKLKRNLEGVSQRANTTGKDFSRMSQGMGGVVRAYATVAANVFALSSAFRVLRDVADFDSLIISSRNLSSITGRNFENVSRAVSDATSSALAFVDAVPMVNKAATAGLDTQQMEQFGTIATKLAQTMGTTVPDSMNRLVDSVQRGEVELLKRVGLPVRLDTATQKYAQSLGKAADQLTEFERKQAIANAIIEEGGSMLGDIEIDPNPYDQLSSSFRDLSQDVISFATGPLGVLAEMVAKSRTAMLLIGATIAKSIINKAIPAIREYGAGLQNTAVQAVEASRKQAAAQRVATNTLQRELAKGARASKKYAQERINDILKVKSVQRSSLVTEGTVDLDERGEVNKLRAQLGRHMSRKAVNIKAFKDLTRSELQELDTLIRTHGAGVANSNKILATNITNTFSITRQRVRKLVAETKASLVSMKTAFITGFTDTQRVITQQGFIASIKNVGTQIKWTTARAKSLNIALPALSGALKGVGAGAAIAASGFSRLLGFVFPIIAAFTTIKLIYDQFFSSTDELNKAHKEHEESLENLSEATEELHKKTEDFYSLQERRGTDTVQALADQFNFLANATNEVSTSIGDVLSGHRRRVRAHQEELESLRERKRALKELHEEEEVNFSRRDAIQVTRRRRNEAEAIQDIEDQIARLGDVAETTQEAFGDIADQVDTLQRDLINKLGLDTFSINDAVRENLTLEGVSALEARDILRGLDDPDALSNAVSNIDSGKVQANVAEAIIEAYRAAFNEAEQTMQQTGSGLDILAEVSEDIDKFFADFRREFMQSAPNTELLSALEEAHQALGMLNEDSEKLQENISDALGPGISNLINNEAGDSIETLRERVDDIRQVFLDLAMDSALAGHRMELLDQRTSALEARRTMSSEERLRVGTELIEIEEERLRLQRNSLRYEVRQLEQLLAAEGTQSRQGEAIAKQLKLKEAELGALNAELDNYDLQLERQLLIKDIMKDQLEIRRDSLELIESSLDSLEEMSIFNSPDSVRAQFKVRKQQAEIERQMELSSIERKRLEGEITEDQAKQLRNLTEQKFLMEDMARSEEQRREAIRAQGRDQSRGGRAFENAFRNPGEAGRLMGQSFGLVAKERLEEAQLNTHVQVSEAVLDAFREATRTAVEGASDLLFGGDGEDDTEWSDVFDAFSESLLRGIEDIVTENIMNAFMELILNQQTEAAVQQSQLAALNSINITLSTMSTQQALGSASQHAEGGVMQGGLNRYANGTVTSGPEIALIGEGKKNEAVVPLPNNREIPVQMQGGGGDTIELNQNLIFEGDTTLDDEKVERIKAEAGDRAFKSVMGAVNRGGRYSKAVGRRGK